MRNRDAQTAQLASAAVVATVVGILVLQCYRAIHGPLDTDFIVFLVGAGTLARDPRLLHDPGAQFVTARHLLNAVPQLNFHSPFNEHPVIAWLMQPLVNVPFQSGIVIFLGVSVAFLAASMYLMSGVFMWRSSSPLGRGAVVIGCMVSLPASVTFAQAQWDTLLLLALVCTLRVVGKHRFIAGLILSLLLLKPQVFWLAIPLMIMAREWRLLGGLSVGGGALVAITAIIVPVSDTVNWVATRLPGMASNSVVNKITVGLPGNLAEYLPSHGAIVSAVLIAVAFVAAAYRMRETFIGRPTVLIMSGVAMSLVATPYDFPYDLILLGPAIVMVGSKYVGIAFAAILALDVSYFIDSVAPDRFAHAEPVALAVLVVLGLSRMRNLADVVHKDVAVAGDHRIA